MLLYHSLKQLTLHEMTALGGSVFFLASVSSFLIVREYHTALQLLSGFGSTLLITVLIRTFYFKQRPLRQEFHTFWEKMDASSFPSLHTARAFFLAFTLGTYFKSKALFSLFIILAIAVAYSRIYLRKHDVWDIAGGIILGFGAYFFTVAFVF